VTHSSHYVMPFPALVGQDAVRRALLLLAVNPRLGGLLISGEKGTAKSTAARGLPPLLPPVEVNAECPYGCAVARPNTWCGECRDSGGGEGRERRAAFETLPLGVTEDQLLGSMNLEHALKHGERVFEPGLMARVNHGVLYVDEVNLLDDHIVDLLLDVAASGVNVVAREGVAVEHPANFLLVGTMNPEEGDLRPQLTDRFGLSVEVRGIADVKQRTEVISRCLAFEADPVAFAADWSSKEDGLRDTIARARAQLPKVRLARRWLEAASRISLALEVDGHRGDVLMLKAASAAAALDGRDELTPEDIKLAATFVYPHRLKRRPFDERSTTADDLAQVATDVLAEMDGKKKPRRRQRTLR